MLRACGVTAFLHPLPSYSSLARRAASAAEADEGAVCCATAELKQVPEDFVVVERDPSGRRTDADDYVLPLEQGAAAAVAASTHATSPDGGDDDVDAGIAAAEDADGGALLTAIPAQTVPPPPPVVGSRSVQALLDVLAAMTPALLSRFGSAAVVASRAASTFTAATLSALLQDVRAATQARQSNPSATADEQSWWAGKPCTLGSFPDRRERQLMHLLVRRRFPHLRTFAEETADTVTCAVDVHYVLFAAALGAEAAHCLARWSVDAQGARQERNLDDATRAALHQVVAHDDTAGDTREPSSSSSSSAAPCRVASACTPSAKSVCHASFDTLTEAMQRGPGGEAAAASEKDVRRHVHDLLRRFYSFVNCQVREGHVTLRPRASSGSAAQPSAAPHGASAGGVGVRRSRAEMEAGASPSGAASAREARDESRSTAPYVHLVVRKRNLETAEMRQLLAEYFGVKDSAVGIAGMKDKTAITVQRCSVPTGGAGAASPARRAEAQARIAALTDSGSIDAAPLPVTLPWLAEPQQSYAVVLRAAAAPAPVQLGQLSGNWFSLRVRDVRWASAAEQAAWSSPSAAPLQPNEAPSRAPLSDPAVLRAFVEARVAQCAGVGFVNYFGQQRFGETIARVDDHTGVHLFARRWVAAVRSLYRACPDVYDAFPDKMESRFVPGNLRDAQVMTHALRQTYRMYFSEHRLGAADVQQESEVWGRLCEKAICETVPFFLRALWVHAAQSAFFNLAASFVVSQGREPGPPEASDSAPSAPLSLGTLRAAQLPLGGFQLDETRALTGGAEDQLEGSEARALWAAWRAAATAHALSKLRWTEAQGFGQRRVAGVPVPGTYRAVVARPVSVVLTWEDVAADAAAPTMRLSFALPSSCYATVFLREVLGCNKWW